MLRRNGRGQGNTDDVVVTKSFDRNHGNQSGINASRQGNERTFEPAFMGVVAQAQHQRIVDVLHVVLGKRRVKARRII